MSTRLTFTIIISSSVIVGLIWGILIGRELEKRDNQQKTFLIQQEVNKIS